MCTPLMLSFVGRQCLLLARDRQIVFWNVVFFLILLLLFLGLLSGGDAAVQVSLAAGVVTTGIMANALFSVAIGLSAARDRGVFRRYWLTPAPAGLPVAGTLCARTLLVFSAAVIQVVVARVVFDVPWSGGALSWIAVAGAGAAA